MLVYIADDCKVSYVPQTTQHPDFSFSSDSSHHGHRLAI
jgi:hypothetical protein